jgi:NDP-sugar pyrophosphorylase family protein
LPKEIDKVIIIAGYLEKEIKEYFKKKFYNKQIVYITQKNACGTWKALKLAEGHLLKEEKFLVLNSDDLHGKRGIKKLLKYQNSILAAQSSTPEKFGVIEKDKKSFLVNIEEKPSQPRTNLVATGVYVISKEIFKLSDPQNKNGEYFLTDVLKEYLKKVKIKVVESDIWVPIGTPEDFINAHVIIDSASKI